MGVCVCVCVHLVCVFFRGYDCNDQIYVLPFFHRGSLQRPLSFRFFFRPALKTCLLKMNPRQKAKQQDCIHPPKAASIGYCQSLSRFYVKLPIHAVSIDQTTKSLFIFFSIQLVFSWLSDSSFISVSECPVLNG